MVDSKIVEIHWAQIPVIELDGFLNASRCILECPGRLFNAQFEQKINGMECIIQQDIENISKNGKFLERTEIDYEGVRQLFIDLIYKKIPPRGGGSLENFDWVLIEYYGLISTADQENGPWNRLLSQTHALIRFVDENQCESVMFYVEYSDFVVITQLGVDWGE